MSDIRWPLRVMKRYCSSDNDVYELSVINFSQKRERLKKEYESSLQDLNNTFKEYSHMLNLVEKAYQQYPNLLIRDDGYIYLNKPLPKIDGVDLITGPYGNFKYASPYMIVDGIKIHQYRFGVLICTANPERFGNDSSIKNEFYEKTKNWPKHIVNMALDVHKKYCHASKLNPKELAKIDDNNWNEMLLVIKSEFGSKDIDENYDESDWEDYDEYEDSLDNYGHDDENLDFVASKKIQ